MKLEQAQYLLEDDGDKAHITLEQYRDGVHLTIQNNGKTVILSTKQTSELRDILYKGLTNWNLPEPKHTHNRFGGMIDCKGCNL